jgi:hypothetical protein
VPAPRARRIILTAAERRRLEKLAYSRAAGYQQVIRARIVLDAACGYPDAEISRRRGRGRRHRPPVARPVRR